MAADFELSRETLDAYNGELDDVTRDAISELVDFLSDYDLDEMDDAARMALRDETIAKVNGIIEDYGDASAAVGADFYETVLDVTDSDGFATMPSSVDSRRVDKAVRRCASDLFGDDADLGRFADGVSDFVARTVSHRADECVAESAVSANEASTQKGRKGKKKFARIPSGPSCGFCIMLASRGFVYATRKSAGELTRFHNRCDCRIVEGYDGMHVEGYDPDGMYRRYKSCRETIGADAKDSPVRRDWERLAAEEKAKYYDPRDPQKKPSYDQYLQHRITEEMDTRDRGWLLTGKLEPCYEVLPGAAPSDDEKETAKRLGAFGFKSEFRPTRGGESKRTSDVFFVIGPKDQPTRTPAEFKGPNGNGRWTIFHQFEDASGQSHLLVIDTSALEKPETGERWTRETIETEVEDQIERTFIIPKGTHKGEPWTFDEVILVSDDGSYCRRFTRKTRQGS